jgi:two-component system cell cycle response regulator DivK
MDAGMFKLLLVDDEEPNRDFLSRRLEKRGYQVVTAVDGIDACQKTAEERPDLILMDINMPGMDGLQATRQIRMTAPSASVPIIGLTALAMPGDRERVLEAGCNDYETKPIDFPSLLTKIQTLLPNPQPG